LRPELLEYRIARRHAGGDERRPALSFGSVRAPVSRSFRSRPGAHRSIGLQRDGSRRIGGASASSGRHLPLRSQLRRHS
jgi:hypothetical protein